MTPLFIDSLAGSPVFWQTMALLSVLVFASTPVFVCFVCGAGWHRVSLAMAAMSLAALGMILSVHQHSAAASNPVRERLAEQAGYPVESFPDRLPDSVQDPLVLHLDDGIVVCHYSRDTEELFCAEGPYERVPDAPEPGEAS